MADHLIVTKPFLNFKRGDVILDATQVQQIMSTEYRKFVIRVAEATGLRG